MIITAIDPGSTKSGIVELFVDAHDIPQVLDGRVGANNSVLEQVREQDHLLVVEVFSDLGRFGRMADEFRDTMIWVGRFLEAHMPGEHATLTRRAVLQHFGCLGQKGTDKLLRAYLIHRWMEHSMLKSEALVLAGPLKDVRTHAWQALAVGMAWIDQFKMQERTDG